MQVILTEKISNLGDLSDNVQVKPGFARNFLIPQGKALYASKANQALFEQKRAELEKQAAQKLKEAQKLAAELEKITLTIETKAGEGGKLFGSIGTRDIAEAICKQGVKVEKNMINMPHGLIRELGEYTISVHLYSDVDVNIELVVKSDS